MAAWTREDVIAAVKRDFPDKDSATVLSVLDELGRESPEEGRARVQIAILRLSKGDVDRLLQYTDAAMKDWRDVLWWSDTPITPD